MRALVIVPARGGSKGLPGGDLREVVRRGHGARVCRSVRPPAQPPRIGDEGAPRRAWSETHPEPRRLLMHLAFLGGVTE
jgi:hypothetical protein